MIDLMRARFARGIAPPRPEPRPGPQPRRLPPDQETMPVNDSARRRLYAVIRREVDADVAATGEVRLPVVTRRVQEELESDLDFLRHFWMESCSSAVYEHVRIVVGRTRLPIRGHQEVTPEGEPVAPPVPQFDWNRWLEHSGDKHIKLKQMTRSDLLSAAAEREARGLREIHLARLLRRIADRLTDDQTVGDVLTDAELDQLEQAI